MSPNNAKNKGDAAERLAASDLTEALGHPVRRKLGAGRFDDIGDLDGIPDTCVQVKYYPSDTQRSIREIMAGLPHQQYNARATYAFGMARRPRGEWLIVMNLEQVAAFIRGVQGWH